MNLFNAKVVLDKPERTAGLMLRLFGIDFCCMCLGWLNDWMVIDFRIPVNCGFSLQIGFIFIGVGRLPDDSLYQD